jgi:two-component system sensor histidine kinase DesK
MLKAAGIAASLYLDAGELPAAVEETLALALREAVTNVVRHSGASGCDASLERHDAEFVLSIADDGRGTVAPDGSGMRGMRARVEAFGGTVTRVPGRGMRLRVALPVSPPGDIDAPDAAGVRGLAG